MAERIAVRHQGVLRDLSTPGGTSKLVGGDDSNDGLILEEHLSPPAEFPDTQFLTHMIAVEKGSLPCPMFWKENGRERSGLIVPGGVCLSTAALQTGIRWGGNMHATVLSIGIPMMERAMPEPFARRPIELTTICAGERDSVLEHMAGALGAMFERCPSSERIAVDSLCNATAVYLAQRYGTLPIQVITYKSGLTQDRLTRVIDYIETYLGNDLSLTELSTVACLSSYHFGKMFKRSTGLSVHQYVIARRLERAKLLLSARKLPLVEIALAVGFQDQSQFTAVFKRRIGITPGAYSRIISGS
jgi:AraC family transcriptional regulator